MIYKKKEKKENWYINKNYLHFDYPLSFNKASDLVKNPDNISTHSFRPFLTFEVTSIKYVEDVNSIKKIRKEKKRPICYASHVDGYIYSYYALQLSKRYEEKLQEKNLTKNVIAFRKLDKKCNIDFAKEAFDDIKKFGNCGVIALDFSKFFDTLNHDILKKQWCTILQKEKLPDDHYKIYKSLTSFSLVNRNDIFKLFNISQHNPKANNRKRICAFKDFRKKVRKKNYIKPNPNLYKKEGIPQGSQMSGLLSNIYMLDFDEKMKNYIQKLDGHYYRYCDDILIIVPDNKLDDIETFAINAIKDLKVTINTQKTEKRTFIQKNNVLYTDKPLQYLGFLFDGNNIFIRSSSISRYYNKMKRGISLAKKTKKKRDFKKFFKGRSPVPLYKNKIYERYSFLGKSNFVTYSHRAKNKMNNSKTIKKQLKRFWSRLNYELK
jgi:hypothetical protein